MNNMNNCSDQTREKLKAAYMSRDLGVDFTREKFERIIAAAEQERIRTLRRRKMIKVALVSLILCAACSGLLMGLITWEDASADNDDETKIIKQGDNMVIGSGVVDGDDIITLTTDEYLCIEDLPKKQLNEAHFIVNDEFTIERIVLTKGNEFWEIDTYYSILDNSSFVISEATIVDKNESEIATCENSEYIIYDGIKVYVKEIKDTINYSIWLEETYIIVSLLKENKINIETIIEGLNIY